VSSERSPGDAAGAVAPDLVRAALARVLDSEEFRGSAQLAAFLRFVVTATLEGREDRIKGYTIATEALGRGDDFDPQADPIVRVEAIRLRRLLAAYYDRVGDAETLRISIPRGGYVPAFEAVARPPPPAAPDRTEPPPKPVIAAVSESAPQAAPEVASVDAVAGPIAAGSARRPWPVVPIASLAFLVGLAALAAALLWRSAPAPAPGVPATPPVATRAAPQPEAGTPNPRDSALRSAAVSLVRFENLAASPDGALIAQRLSERLITALARFDELRVASPQPAGVALAVPGPLDFRFAGTIEMRLGEIVASLRVEHARTGEVVWSQVANFPSMGQESMAAEDALVRNVATVLAQPYGVIAANVLQRLSNLEGPVGPYACLLAAFEYWRSFDATGHLSTRECLERAVAAEPNFAEAHAVLTYFYLDESRYGFNPVPGRDPLDRALDVAERAVGLRPQSARALQALCAAQFLRGQPMAALRHCERARLINPFDTDIAADLGAKYVLVGEFRRGLALLDEAAAFRPNLPAWHGAFTILAAYLQGDMPEALARARAQRPSRFPLDVVMRAIIRAGAGDRDGAQRILESLVREAPDLAAAPAAALRRQIPNEAIVERLARELAQLGFGVAR